MIVTKALIIAFGVVSLASFVLYIVDKLQAENRLPRIPEWVLLLVPFIGGGTGAVFGMLVFHHKTKHWCFYFVNAVGILLHAAILVFLLNMA